MKKFLIGQLARYGDCLYATTVAKQIKKDHPQSHITWAIASQYKSILEQNPYVDTIWEINVKGSDYYRSGWNQFEKEAMIKKQNGEFDELVFTQVPDKYWLRFDGTIRSSILNGYKRPITVSVEPVVRLAESEIRRVKSFAGEHRLSIFKHVVLFECNPGSIQSFVTVQYALDIAVAITKRHSDICFILSSTIPVQINNTQIISASTLSFRENAELTKYCTLLIGCSSGITWLCTSDWAKKINMLQLLKSDFSLFAGVKFDFKKWGIPTDNVIEVTNDDKTYISECIRIIIEQDFSIAKKKYDEELQPSYATFEEVFTKQLIRIRYIIRLPLFILQFHKNNKHLHLSKLIFISCKAVLKVASFKK